MSDKRFYMTYARSRPNELVPFIEEHSVPLLTNAFHRWSDNTDRFLHMWEYDTPHVIDAGGYNVQAAYMKANDVSEYADEIESSSEPFYPYSLDEYHEWLQNHTDEFEWATAMDYACEDRFNELWSVEDRIEATFENTLKHFNKDPSYKVLPVLQGRSVEDYVEFYDRLEDHGIPTDHLGLGTICRLSSEKRIANLEQKVRERTDVDRLHGFGVKIEAFKHGAEFDSADSQAWVYSASNGKVIVDEGDRMRRIPHNDSLTRTVESFKNYYSYVTRLQSGESAVDYSVDVSDLSDEAAAEALLN